MEYSKPDLFRTSMIKLNPFVDISAIFIQNIDVSNTFQNYLVCIDYKVEIFLSVQKFEFKHYLRRCFLADCVR